MGGLAPWHWIVIIAALVVLFGSKRLPDAARGLGRSMRIFRTEIKEMQHEHTASAATPPMSLAPRSASEAGTSGATEVGTPEQEHEPHHSA